MSDYPRNGRGGGGNGGPERHARNRGRGGGGPYQRDGPPAWRGGGGGGGGGRNGFRGGARDDDGRIQYRGPGGGGHMYRGPPTTSGPFVPRQFDGSAAAATPVSPPQPKIDRTKICPLLLRVYIQTNAHHSASSFAVRGEEPNEDSILIYTWPDASLRELAGLIQQVNPESRSPSRELSFAFVYPDKSGTNVIKHVMTIPSRAPTQPIEGSSRGRGGAAAQQALARLIAADQKQLQQLKFETGDSLSVALLKTNGK